MARRAQVTASIFLDLIIIRGGIEMDIQLVKVGFQPVGVVSIKDGAPRQCDDRPHTHMDRLLFAPTS